MKNYLLLLLLFPGLGLAVDEIDCPITRVQMFKNGLALVERAGTLPGPGEYRIRTIGLPVHGTLWVETGAPVVLRTRMEESDEPIHLGEALSPQRDLSGARVRIHFKEGTPAPVDGIVEQLPTKPPDDNTATPVPNPYGVHVNPYAGQVPSRFLILRNAQKGHSFIDPTTIAMIQTMDQPGKVRRKKPTLLVKASAANAKGPIQITYMCRGISWAPSYQVELSDDKELRLTQKAVVKNELGDLDRVTMQLISGFPNFTMGHVTSPLAPQQSWQQFFAQLNQDPSAGHRSTSNSMRQQAVMFNSAATAPTGGALGGAAIPGGEGVDLHVQDLGRLDLQYGETLAVQTARSNAEYERIVEWIIPDTRNTDGRYIDDYRRQQNPDKYEDSAWDAVRFRNPFKMPMTTAPAYFVRRGGVAGQQMSYWVNAGEQTSLRITKALSLRTRHTELEVAEKDREVVYVGGRRFQKVRVKGTCELHNHRAETLQVIARRKFSGELLEASDKPETRLLESGVYSVNRHNELNWEFSLEAGKEKTLTYEYEVLVKY